MSGARAAVLARLRAAQRTLRLPDVSGLAREIRFEAPDAAAWLERFLAELSALGVTCHVEAGAEEVRQRILSRVRSRRLLSWDPGALPYGIGAALETAPVLGSSPRSEQAAAEIGLTGCAGAIAETGSLALLSGPGRSRAVSLLPPVHVAVVRREDLCFDMAEFFERQRGPIGEAASLTFVTGPSRTADIELSLTLGVHGPGAVEVVVGP